MLHKYHMYIILFVFLSLFWLYLSLLFTLIKFNVAIYNYVFKIKNKQTFYNTSNFVSALENRQGLKIACLEEISLLNGWIKKKEVIKQIKFYGDCEYSKYLKRIIK